MWVVFQDVLKIVDVYRLKLPYYLYIFIYLWKNDNRTDFSKILYQKSLDKDESSK